MFFLTCSQLCFNSSLNASHFLVFQYKYEQNCIVYKLILWTHIIISVYNFYCIVNKLFITVAEVYYLFLRASSGKNGRR
jgi:hypothetical protein